MEEGSRQGELATLGIIRGSKRFFAARPLFLSFLPAIHVRVIRGAPTDASSADFFFQPLRNAEVAPAPFNRLYRLLRNIIHRTPILCPAFLCLHDCSFLLFRFLQNFHSASFMERPCHRLQLFSAICRSLASNPRLPTPLMVSSRPT